jgi:hypothetical protein
MYTQNRNEIKECNTHGQVRKVYRMLVGKPRKGPFVRPTSGWVDMIHFHSYGTHGNSKQGFSHDHFNHSRPDVADLYVSKQFSGQREKSLKCGPILYS